VTVACIVLAHRAPEQLALLISALHHRHVRVYVHLDRRIPSDPFSEALDAAGPNDVVPLPRRDARWGGIVIVDATLTGLARGVADGCDYFFLLSGQDFPLRPMGDIVELVREAGSRSYVRHFALPAPHWRFGGRDRTDFYTYDLLGRRETCIPKGEDVSFMSWRGLILNELLRMRTTFKPPRRFPRYARPFGGSQWWNLSRAAADYILRFLDEHPDYRRYHQHTLAPDELFFQSILIGTDFAQRHEILNDDLRFAVWPQGASHPRTLIADDLTSILESKKLFARKFDAVTDHAVLEQLAARFGVGTGVMADSPGQG
jgi:Core-2/I-Branching enzyme